MTPIISVCGISKRYKLGQIQGYKTIRESFSNLFHSPKSLSQISKSLPLDGGGKVGVKASEGAESRDFIWALKDVSFEVQPGEVIGIIGRNGSGKSTLLKILTRITEPTEGTARIRGQVASLLEVGTGFHPELTGRENVYLNGAILGMRKTDIDQKFDEIIAFAEVERFVDTPVKRYSSGMYVRLAFAVAAHLEPEILLVDEVLSVGDASFQKKCLGKMGDVAKGGRTVLFVSHNMSAISSLCARAILLDKGKVSFSGSAVDAVREYLGSIESDKNKMEWVAPERKFPFSEVVKIKKYYLSDEDNNIPDGKLFNSRNYNVVIEADLYQSDGRLIFGILYYSQDGTILFATDINDTGKITFDKVKPGPIKLLVPVPVDLLGNRVYEIELVCALHYTGWILQPGNETRIRFEFFRDIDLNPYSNETRLGALTPVLEWKVSSG